LNPVSPIFFLQTPHFRFLGLLGLSLFDFLSLGKPNSAAVAELMLSSFLRFELVDGCCSDDEGEDEGELCCCEPEPAGTGAIIALGEEEEEEGGKAIELFGEEI